MPDDPTDLTTSIRYRIASGHAADLAERHRHYSDWRADPSARILADVARMMTASAEDETIKEAVGDTIAGRRPRW